MSKLRLSEAIRLGSMLRPQTRGNLYYHYRGEIRSCAYGAALEAAGLIAPAVNVDTSSDALDIKAEELWPVMTNAVLKCPASGRTALARTEYYYDLQNARDGVQVVGIIQHLNDSHRWTRERIADWVVTVEPAADPEPVETPRAMTAPVLA